MSGSMTTEKAQGLVVTAFTASSALVVIAHAGKDELPPVRMIIGTTVAAVMLATAAQLSPDVAGAFAVLILTAAALVYGGPAWNVITKATAPTPRAPAAGGPSGTRV